MYANGEGVPKDLVHSSHVVSWLRRGGESIPATLKHTKVKPRQ